MLVGAVPLLFGTDSDRMQLVAKRLPALGRLSECWKAGWAACPSSRALGHVSMIEYAP